MRKTTDKFVSAAGLFAAAAVLAWVASVWLAMPSQGSDAFRQQLLDLAASHSGAQEPQMLAQFVQPQGTGLSSRAPAAQAPRACAFEPMLPGSTPRDGAYRVDALPGGGWQPGPFVAAAKEALDENRLRDAEAALIVACRVAAQAMVQTVAVASVQARLAGLYARVGRQGGDEAQAVRLNDRARALLTESSATLHKVLGAQASRTRVVDQQLRELDMAAAAGDDAGPGMQDAHDAPVAGGEAEAARAKAVQSVQGTAPELAQLESDMARLRAQARALSSDPAGFERRMAQAQQRRDSCRDAACVLRWYAQHKRELISEF